MRNTNKKGFTIVELVIVVAVIAILAAVLIPTFSGIIAKAQLSADQRAEREMNNAIAMEGADTLEEAMAALEKNGINAKHLIPVSAGYSFVWNKNTNKIELVKGEDKESIAESIKEIAVTVNTTEAFLNAIDEDMKYIKLDADVNIDTSDLDIKGNNVTIDLNGKKITTTQETGRSKYLNVKGSATFVNGTIEARGIQVFKGAKLVVGKDANLVVNSVDSNGGAALWIYAGAEVEINGGTFTAVYNNTSADISANKPVAVHNSGKLTINGGTFNAYSTTYAIISVGELIVNGGVVNGYRGAVSVDGGKATINGGTFNVKAPAGVVAHTLNIESGAECTVNGGTFNGTIGGTFVDKRNP